MLPYRTQYLIKSRKVIIQNFSSAVNEITTPQSSYCTSSGAPKYTELPRKLRRSERKPFVTHMTEIKRRARLEKQMRQEAQEIILRPPENGLLVKRLIPVAHEVYAARYVLFDCVSKIVQKISIHFCRLCGEVHVGSLPHKIRSCYVASSLPSKEHSWVKGGIENILPLAESFHMYDRIGRAVSHEEYLQVDRIPAILELCIQAGVDIPEYPTRRRSFPVYSISGKMIDFERKFPPNVAWGKGIQAFGFWERHDNSRVDDSQALDCNDLQVFSHADIQFAGARYLLH